ncbi:MULTISPECIES: cupin domain-containing protein [Paracoccus]|jgi:transcriptional regulator with XRE-family HTH domain|uniref:Cupin domain-containing protein n=1 Tax=Paracoccus aerius TaxID=1915382 RepID=A0ABS1S003_9RHOB|nr:MULTISPECIES: cupin domain-containing protein [Paracoccus]MBL3672038.1 cupin domain-containing protein [Paracoccus aerius]QIR86190.1 cupin domain-containing protein [Paracoccus sp. AK26]GHG13195.1 DNA-binding protein [Paracoccus aerius]
MARQDDDEDRLVAMRLRVVRRSVGLSQRELARRAGVGSGTISQIESLSLKPSVSVLKRILDAVPMDLATFFSFDLSADQAQVFRRADHVNIGAPGIRYLLLAAQRPGRAIQMLHEFYEPSTSSGRHVLSHAGEECGIVVSGTLEVTIGDEVNVLHPGDGYYFNSSLPHRFRNIGTTVCEVVSACTPPSF